VQAWSPPHDLLYAVPVGALAASFLARWKGRDSTASGDLQAALETVIRLGRERWPDFSIDAESFVEYLAQRASSDTDPVTALGMIRAEDLYLACACAHGSPSAIRWFETHLLSKLPAKIVQTTHREELVDETLQVLREKLLVGAAGSGPRITQYSGHGALENWVRVAALRTALNLLAAEKPHEPLQTTAESISAGIPPGANLELDYIRVRYRGAFVAAFQATMAELSDRERNILRLQYIDELTPERIGRIYAVHRTTAMRWIDNAQEHLLQGIRGALMKQLGISDSECDSLLNLVRSHLPGTLPALLNSSQG
jgi:RNA polymerase sigma-70 factor (ECF subfamily)